MKRHSVVRAPLALMLLGVVPVGCSRSLGSDGPDISLHGLLHHTALEPPVMRVDIGGRRVTIEFYQVGSRPGLTTEIHGPRYGDVPVHATLVSRGGDRLASVEFTQRFERGSNHWVTAIVGLQRPGGHCIGTLEVAPLPANAFPESGGVPDTLFVMHGSIPKGAIC